MSARSNTVPYTNAHRAGRTNPDLVERVDSSDPRHESNRVRYVPNRADLRARGVRGPRRRRYVARCRKVAR